MGWPFNKWIFRNSYLDPKQVISTPFIISTLGFQWGSRPPTNICFSSRTLPVSTPGPGGRVRTRVLPVFLRITNVPRRNYEWVLRGKGLSAETVRNPWTPYASGPETRHTNLSTVWLKVGPPFRQSLLVLIVESSRQWKVMPVVLYLYMISDNLGTLPSSGKIRLVNNWRKQEHFFN